MCGDPLKSNIFATKSFVKQIFKQCDIPISVSAYDIYEK